MTTEWPWLEGVEGTEVRNIIESDAPLIKVESGPGTGKTFALVRRVERIIHPLGLGVAVTDVLVLAFNRVIAKKLKSEIEERFAPDFKNFPSVQTIHAFCVNKLDEDKRILLPSERDAMLYDVRYQHPELGEEFGGFKKIEQALNEHEANIKKHKQLWDWIRDWLGLHNAWLISEAPVEVRSRLKTGDFQDLRYAHVIVDEFQDLTPCEQELVGYLVADQGTLMILGDPQQSIYAFRGNNPRGLSEFKPQNKEVSEDHSMTRCRRCPPEIVQAANYLMNSGGKELIPASNIHANIRTLVWDDVQSEIHGMASAIVKKIRDSKSGSRNNSSPTHLAMVTRRRFGYLLKAEINDLDSSLKVDMNFSESLLEEWQVREKFIFFCLLTDPDPVTWRSWFSYQNPNSKTSYKAPARNAAAYWKFRESCSGVITENHVLELAETQRCQGQGRNNIIERARRYRELRTSLKWDGINVASLIDEIFTVEFPTDGKNDSFVCDMEQISTKLHEMLEGFDLKRISTRDQLKNIARLLRYHIGTREPFETDPECDLQITTLWGGKGVTADHVYILGLCNGAMPGIKPSEYPGTEQDYNDEKRRLFYVSITRPRETLILSYAKRISYKDAMQLGIKENNSKSRKRTGFCALTPSEFLRNLCDYFPPFTRGESWDGSL